MKANWTEATLGDVAEIQQGQNLAISTLTTGEYPVYGANGIVGHFDKWNFDQDVVALGCRGSCGTVHSVTGKVWLANNVMAIWPKNESQVAVAFIALILETADLRSSGVISGQVQPQITRTSLSPLGLTIPPLAEQKRIIEIVLAMDDAICSTELAVTDAQRLRSGLLSDLLSGDHEIPESYDRLLGVA
jgi:type I restriction enzyme S subunit